MRKSQTFRLQHSRSGRAEPCSKYSLLVYWKKNTLAAGNLDGPDDGTLTRKFNDSQRVWQAQEKKVDNGTASRPLVVLVLPNHLLHSRERESKGWFVGAGLQLSGFLFGSGWTLTVVDWILRKGSCRL